MNKTTYTRSQLVKRNIVASFLIKGWSAAIVYIMVPLTIKMLSVYSNGVWLTISSILMWIDMFDIGLGNGLRNAIAEYNAKGETENIRTAISSTLGMLVTIIIPVCGFIIAAIYFSDIYGWLGIDSTRVDNLRTTLTVAATMICTSFVFKTVGNVFMGLQLPAVNNLLLCIGQTLSLICTAIAYMTGCRSLLCVVAINTTAPLAVWVISYYYTFYVKYKHLRPSTKCMDFKIAKKMCSTGIEFFTLQACGIILFMSANIIISKLFSPAEVTPYQIAYRYFSIMITLFTIICMPFWNATTDAYTRGDIDWIKRASRKMDYATLCIAITLVSMIWAADPIYTLWIGNEVKVPTSLSVTMSLYVFILIASQRYSYFLNGIGALKIQIIFTTIATIAFLPMASIVCNRYPNITALTAVMCLINLPGLLANAWKFQTIIGRSNNKNCEP